MNREIKFRFWNNKLNIITYPKPKLADAEMALGYAYMLMGKNSEYIPMQFTGLKDKNVKEIYEGDIIKEGYHEKYGRRIVKWEDDGFNLFQGGDNSWEVIGNIYENPELLLS